MAMNKAPDFSNYANVKVTAASDYEGTSIQAYDPERVFTHKYLTFSENTDSAVTNRDLTNKLSVPAIGGTPVTAITEDDQYTGTVKWNGNPTKFLGGTTYTATVTLTAKESYTFCNVARNSFTHTGADGNIVNALGVGESLTVTIVFPQTQAKTLQSIAITKAPDKVDYKYAETFSTAGMVVKAIYNDGTTDANFAAYLADKTGPLALSDTLVTLTANGTSVTATQAITVSKKTPTAADLICILTAVSYNGNAKPISVTAAFGKNLGAITVKYNSSITAPTDADIYAITVDIAENAEYYAVSGLSLGSYTINKIEYPGITTVSVGVWTSGQAGASVSLPTLPADASYGTPVAGGTIVMTGMGIAGTTLTYTAPASIAGQTGTMTIPVTGATNYNDYSIVVTVTYTAKTPQVISYAAATVAKTYGDTTFVNPLTQTTVKGTITYASDDTSVATVNSSTGEVTIVAVGDGKTTITATAAETGAYAQATASYIVTVARKALTLKADDKSMTKGDGLPNFTYTATGLANSDALTTPPTMSAVTDGAAVGTFDVTISGGVVTNAVSYDITHANGILTVAERLFTATVTNGTGSGSYAEGATVTITAKDRSGGTFTGWSGADVAFADATAKTTTFTMPAKAVTVTANYRQNSSGGGSSDSSPVIVTPPTPDKPSSSTQGEIKVPGTVDSKGNVTANITSQIVTNAFNKALADAKKNGNERNGITLVLNVSGGNKTVNNVSVNLPKAVQNTIIAKKIVNTLVVMDNPDIRVGMDLATVTTNRQNLM